MKKSCGDVVNLNLMYQSSARKQSLWPRYIFNLIICENVGSIPNKKLSSLNHFTEFLNTIQNPQDIASSKFLGSLKMI